MGWAKSHDNAPLHCQRFPVIIMKYKVFLISRTPILPRPRLGARLRGARARRTELTQDVERIDRAHFVKKPADPSLCMLLAADRAHAPGRQVSGERILLIARHRIVAHPGEEIVGLIIL